MSAPTVDLYRLAVHYQQDGLNHVFQTWILPSGFTTVATGSFNDYSFSISSGSIAANTWLSDFMNEYPDIFPDSTDFTEAILYAYEANSLDAIFLAAQSLTESGTSVSAAIPGQQIIMVARTATGRIKKFIAMECFQSLQLPVSWDSSAVGAINVFGAYVESANGSAMVARDGSRVIALKQFFVGQNEAVWKKRFRPNN